MTVTQSTGPFIDVTPGFETIQEAVDEYFMEETIMDYKCKVYVQSLKQIFYMLYTKDVKV